MLMVPWFRRKMARQAREFNVLNREDSDQPFEQHRGYTAVIALLPGELVVKAYFLIS